MDEMEIMRRIFFSTISALIIATITSVVLGERKTQWFHRRESWNIFTKRGFIGEQLNFGRPVCKEGYMVSAAMLAAMAAVTAIIFVV